MSDQTVTDALTLDAGKALLEAVIRELRNHHKKGFSYLSEHEQDGAIRRIEAVIREQLIKAFRGMVAADFPNAVATLEKVAFTAKGVQGTLSLGAAGEHRHAFADYAGRAVVVVLASAEKYLERMGEVRGEADQPQLDLPTADSTSGFDSERHDVGTAGAGEGDGEAEGADADGEAADGDDEATPAASSGAAMVDEHPGEITVAMTVDALELVLEVDEELVGEVHKWTQDMRREVLDYCGASHMANEAASGTVEVPPVPAVLASFFGNDEGGE